MSATLPMGSNMAAPTRTYEADTQLKVTAETWNSSPMSGRATLMPEVRNVTRNPPKLADEQHQGTVGAGKARWVGVRCGHPHKVSSKGAPRPLGRRDAAAAGGSPPGGPIPDGPSSAVR